MHSVTMGMFIHSAFHISDLVSLIVSYKITFPAYFLLADNQPHLLSPSPAVGPYGRGHPPFHPIVLLLSSARGFLLPPT